MGVYQKMLANLVSWLRISVNLNRLKCPKLLGKLEVGNPSFKHK